jgi:hypothetical protein
MARVSLGLPGLPAFDNIEIRRCDDEVIEVVIVNPKAPLCKQGVLSSLRFAAFPWLDKNPIGSSHLRDPFSG